MPKRKPRERNKRGNGTVYPVTNKHGVITRYAAAVPLGTIEGKRRRKVIYGKTEAEVEAELTKLRADLLRGIDIAPEKLTIEQYLNAWLKSVALSRSAGTLRIYRNAVKHIVKHLGDRTLQALKAEHVEYLMSELKAAGLIESTCKGVRAVLVTALDQAAEREYITKNVAKQVKAPRIRKGKVKALNEAQVSRLLRTAIGHWLEPLIQLALRLGLRSGEVRGLLWADIDVKDKTIRISGAMKTIEGKRVRESTKTEDSETIMPLASGLAKLLEQRRKQQQQDRERASDQWEEHGLVFTDEYGRPLDGSMLAQAFKRLARTANLPPHITFHGLRHTCAALLIKRGARERKVMEVMRHKSIKTTMDIYGHMFPEATRDVVDDLDRDLDRLAAGGEA
jgi:integrase